MFLKLTNSHGTKTVVNSHQIMSVVAVEEGCRITLAELQVFITTDSFEEVCALLDPWDTARVKAREKEIASFKDAFSNTLVQVRPVLADDEGTN